MNEPTQPTVQIPTDYRLRVRRVVIRNELDFARRVIAVRDGFVLVKHADLSYRSVPLADVVAVI